MRQFWNALKNTVLDLAHGINAWSAVRTGETVPGRVAGGR